MKKIFIKLNEMLELRSKREQWLLYALCFVCGFSLCFYFISNLNDNLSAKIAFKDGINSEILHLENELYTKEHLQSNLKVEKNLEKSILELERDIKTQEQQISSLNKKFGIYFIDEIANKSALKDIKITKEGSNIFLEGSSNLANLSAFFSSFSNQSYLDITLLNLYPNAYKKDIEIKSIFTQKSTQKSKND